MPAGRELPRSGQASSLLTVTREPGAGLEVDPGNGALLSQGTCRNARLRGYVAALLILILIALAGGVAIGLGQDANWDLQNYHFYNPWAWLRGRGFDRDIAAAQIQTYHNPLGDLPFYWMVDAGWNPRLIAFVLAIPAGISAFFVARIAWDMFVDLGGYDRVGATVAAVAIGVTGNMGVGQLGTTFNEWPVTALVIAAAATLVRVLVRSTGALVLTARTLAGSGFLAGLACGLKLTAAPFTVGLCVGLLLRGPRASPRWRDALVFALATLAGMAVTYGWWGVVLWERFRNPFFPYFNELFGSPWWGPWPAVLRHYGPHTWQQWIEFPWRLHSPDAFFVSEVTYTDWRFAVLYSLALFALLAWVVRRVTRAESDASEARPSRATAAFRFVSLFFAVSFVVWTASYSILRYTIELELLTGVLIVGLVLRMLQPPFARTGVIVAMVGLIATTRYPDWWRVPYGDRWFDVRVPAIEPNALIVLASGAPMAYTLPFFPADARHVGIRNNANVPGRDTLLMRSAIAALASHAGPLYELSYTSPLTPATDLSAYHVRKVEGSCMEVRTNMRISPMQLCRLQRVGNTDKR